MSTVERDKVILVHYTLRDDRGEELDSSIGDEPLPYLHGHDNIVPGLEAGLVGKAVGYKGTIVVSPDLGYGEHDGNAPQQVPRDAFPDDFPMQVGIQLVIENELNQRIPVWISEITDEVVMLDTNHPLAGETLHFEIEVMSVRDATAEELQHGHPHGPDGTGGHHHGH